MAEHPPSLDADLPPIDAAASGQCPERIAAAIRAGKCPSDRAFDRFLPHDLRDASRRHWTPLIVALRAAEWLDGAGVRTVVDLGSGAGKFCVAAALASRCSYVGIEQRRRRVDAAVALAELFGVAERVRFVHGALGRGIIPVADAYYLYNPFGENLFGPEEALGNDVELSRERYHSDIALMEAFFDQATEGTLVVKYNGFGGRMPRSYQQIVVDREMPDVLRLWRKGPARVAGSATAP